MSKGPARVIWKRCSVASHGLTDAEWRCYLLKATNTARCLPQSLNTSRETQRDGIQHPKILLHGAGHGRGPKAKWEPADPADTVVCTQNLWSGRRAKREPSSGTDVVVCTESLWFTDRSRQSQHC